MERAQREAQEGEKKREKRLQDERWERDKERREQAQLHGYAAKIEIIK